jgi:hypothetical protein
MQAYNPKDSKRAMYSLWFDICGLGCARILVSRLRDVDLVDLNHVMWNELERIGYSRFWIVRTDGKAMTKKEQEALEIAVSEDFYYDYTEEELNLVFFPSPRFLLVDVFESTFNELLAFRYLAAYKLMQDAGEIKVRKVQVKPIRRLPSRNIG